MFGRKKKLNDYSDSELEHALLKRRKQISTQMLDESRNAEFMTGLLTEETELDKLFKQRFDTVLKNIEFNIISFYSDKLFALKSIRKIISLDLAYSTMSLYAYVRKPFDAALPLSLPIYYYSKNQEKIALKEITNDINLRDAVYIGLPYQNDKWKYRLKRKTPSNPEQFSRAYPYYYPELDLVLQGSNNKHRVAEAFLNRRDSLIRVCQYDDEPLFENVDTDGAFWINKHTNTRFQRTYDFRFALIYKIRLAERNQLKNQVEHSA